MRDKELQVRNIIQHASGSPRTFCDVIVQRIAPDVIEDILSHERPEDQRKAALIACGMMPPPEPQEPEQTCGPPQPEIEAEEPSPPVEPVGDDTPASGM